MNLDEQTHVAAPQTNSGRTGLPKQMKVLEADPKSPAKLRTKILLLLVSPAGSRTADLYLRGI